MSIIEIGAIVVIALLFILIVELFRCKHVINTTETTVKLKNLPFSWDGVRIIQVSDLHGKSFGAKNGRLEKAIVKACPDYIFCTGDIVDCYQSDNRSFFEIANRLQGIAPIFFSLGNHESRLLSGSYSFPWDFAREIKSSGITLLDNTSHTVIRNGEPLVFAGYSQPLDMTDKNRDPLRRFYQHISVNDIQQVLPKKDACTLLLAHNPNPFDSYSAWGADLTFAGHIHGGMWRLFGKGVLSPNVTFFPPYTSGIYQKNGKQMYVSRGLSASHLPRLFNAPHLPVIVLRCDQE